mmetsp:Transcript_14680/g.32237  ORF Transcript_14680/g.32237 Transcript_14680/m.32237 type:complete len:207 (+) Transcript_14680:272-892(+)
MFSSSLKGVTPASMVYSTTPRLQMSTDLLNSRFGSSMKSIVKSAVRLPKISAIAVTPALVPAPISLKSLINGMFVMSTPLILVIAHPSPTPAACAWPPGSMPLTIAPFPFGRCEMMPKPGDICVGGLKVMGPCVFAVAPLGRIIILADTSSGAMISVVPTQLLPKLLATYLATPKSMSFTFDVAVSALSHTRMFSHFRSLCRTFLL